MDSSTQAAVDELVKLIADMSPAKRARLERAIQAEEDGPQLSPRQRALVDSYCTNFDEKKAREAAGLAGTRGNRVDDPEIADAIDKRLAQRERESDLKADYVRSYLLSILELCPTDHFVVNEDGDWCIDPENFATLPVEVKRLVEEVEVKFSRGQKIYKIKFISKTAALAMAAKFTLVQKAEVNINTPWDELARSAMKEVADPVERRLAEYGSRLSAIQGPVPPEEPAVAGRVLLLEATGGDKVGVGVEADGGPGRAQAG